MSTRCYPFYGKSEQLEHSFSASKDVELDEFLAEKLFGIDTLRAFTGQIIEIPVSLLEKALKKLSLSDRVRKRLREDIEYAQKERVHSDAKSERVHSDAKSERVLTIPYFCN